MIKNYENKDLAKYVVIENKSKVVIHGVKPGKKIRLKAGRNGLPLSLIWRKRLRDAKRDNSVEIVKDNAANTKPDKNKED